MTIAYDSKKTNPDLLRQQISKLGYNADNVKADPAARAKLPACCQVDQKPGQESGCSGHDANKGGCSGRSNSGCGGCSGHNHGQSKDNNSQCKEKSSTK